MSSPHFFRVDRRTTLRWFGAAVATSSAGLALFNGDLARAAVTAGSGQDVQEGYGKDPNLFDPHVPWSRTMTEAQLKQVAVLSDILLPKVDSYPWPSEVGVPDFVDEWVSAPYPSQLQDRALILAGLAWLDSESQRRWKKEFVALELSQQTELFGETAKLPTPQDPKAMELYGFFRRLRTVAVGSYYTMQKNYGAIGYIGNMPMQSFPPPTPEENAFIDNAIETLKL